jgi:hypothetical protein
MAAITQSFSRLFLKLFRVEILENLGFLAVSSCEDKVNRDH